MLVRFICFLIVFNSLGLGISNIFIKKNIEKISILNDIEDESENNEKDITHDEFEKNIYSHHLISFQNFNFLPIKKIKSFTELPISDSNKFGYIVIPPPKIN